MYENYLNINNIPSGAILQRILKKEKMSQRELAHNSGMPAQRINDLIAGRRRFTPQTSMQIEAQLPLTTKGYFYIIQCNHDIFLAQQEAEQQPLTNGFSKALFWDTDINKLNIRTHKNFIVQRAFEYGTPEEIRLTISLYGKDEIKAILSTITSPWKKETRNTNANLYLS